MVNFLWFQSSVDIIFTCSRESGSVKIISQISMQTLGGMKSAGNRGVLQSSFQVPHIHVLLVAPLRAGYMAQPGTDQHKGGVAIDKVE